MVAFALGNLAVESAGLLLLVTRVWDIIEHSHFLIVVGGSVALGIRLAKLLRNTPLSSSFSLSTDTTLRLLHATILDLLGLLQSSTGGASSASAFLRDHSRLLGVALDSLSFPLGLILAFATFAVVLGTRLDVNRRLALTLRRAAELVIVDGLPLCALRVVGESTVSTVLVGALRLVSC